MGRPNLPQSDGLDGEEAGQGDNPLNEDGTMERENYWSDDDGSSSNEHKSEGEGNEMVMADNESETEKIENQHVTHL